MKDRWNAYNLYSRYTANELVTMGEAIRADPANANPARHSGRSVYLYSPAARRKLDALAHAITFHLKDRDGAEASR